jgi:hypothetical protein
MLHIISTPSLLYLRDGVTLEQYAEAMRSIEPNGWWTDGGRLLSFYQIVMEPKIALVSTEYKEGWCVRLEVHLPDSVRPTLEPYGGYPSLPGEDIWVYRDSESGFSYIISKDRADRINEQIKLATSTLHKHRIVR